LTSDLVLILIRKFVKTLGLYKSNDMLLAAYTIFL